MVNIDMMQYTIWIADVDEEVYKHRDFIRINCRNITLLNLHTRTLSHTTCNQGKLCTKSTSKLAPIVPRHILQYNEEYFCSQERDRREVDTNLCSIIVADILDWDTRALLLVPCDMKLDKVKFACSDVDYFTPSEGFPRSDFLQSMKNHEEAFQLSYKDCYKMYYGNKQHHMTCTFTKSWRRPLFHVCQDYTYILNHHVCDGNIDCPDGGDEETCAHVCTFGDNVNISNIQQCFLSCHRSNCTCSPLYYQCESGGCVPSSMVCDSYSDCSDGSDEAAFLCSWYMKDLYTTFSNDTYEDVAYDRRSCRSEVFDRIAYLPNHHIFDGINHCFLGIDEISDDCSTFTVTKDPTLPKRRIIDQS